MSTFDLIIFDNDGVLVDSEPLANRILTGLLTSYGLGLTREECIVPSKNSFTRFTSLLPQKNAYARVILRCFAGDSETTSTKRRYALVREVRGARPSELRQRLGCSDGGGHRFLEWRPPFPSRAVLRAGNPAHPS